MTRVCATPDCRTVLSSLNPDDYCWPCQDGGRVPEVHECSVCGKSLEDRAAYVKYCSDECKAEGKRVRDVISRARRVKV